MAARKTICLWVICGIILSLAGAGTALGQDISPAQTQEFFDAKEAFDSARKAQAENYSPETMKTSGDFLNQAESARSSKDGVRFSQASRLARAYAELAEALAELKKEEEKLAATTEDIKKIKGEIERLNKN
jgi:hypothetical protein